MGEMVPELYKLGPLEKRNLELKAKIVSVSDAETCAKAMGAEFNGVLYQTDTYFHCNIGRLKLREVRSENKPDYAELIFYNRPDHASQRWSSYYLTPISHPVELKTLLEASNGVHGVVEKARTLYMWKNSRIHLDQVTNLGTFLEFEVISDSDTVDDQHRMDTLISAFDIDPSSTIAGSYSDLLSL